MTETPEQGDQDQSETPANPGPGSWPEAQALQSETNQPSSLLQEQAPTGEQALNPLSLPIDEVEDEDEENGEKPMIGKPEQEEAARQKEHLDEQAMWQEDASSQQQKRIKQRENERHIELGKRNISLKKLETPDIQRANHLFVEPEGYQKFEQQIRQSTGNHILVVAGQERSGKLMTALYLAQRLWPKKELEFYLFVDRSNKTLLEIISDENLPDNAIILFDDVFSKDQIKLDNLTNPLVHLNEDLANLTNVWFIFTVLNGPILDALLQARNFPILFTTGVNCQQVLEKLIDSFFPEKFSFENERAELLATREKLNPRLTPSDLRQLFDTKENDLKALINALTKKEGLEHKAPHIWFNELKPMNYQLYALLVVLFDKLDMPTLEEIYTEAVNALRQQGMDSPDEFIDPRRIGTNLMHTELGIQVRFNVLEFRSRTYRQYAEAQVENFQRLLWSLIDPDDPSTFTGLVGLIHRLSKYDLQLASHTERDEHYTASSDQLRQLRYAIAVMIAQVGVYHLPNLDLLLGKLVHDESALVSLTAAFVLAEIARRGEHFDFIEKLLKVWCQSRRFDQMWAAAASIAYIYEAIARTLEDVRAPLTEEDELDEERDEEERETTTTQDQKQRGKGYLARLRDILTELAKTYDLFSDEAINEERRNMYAAYRERLRQQFEAASEPVTDNAHLFRDLSKMEQEQYLNFVYTKRKKAIDEAVKRDINVLTNSWKNQMRMVLMQTLKRIARMWPRDITRLVRIWLDRKDTENPLWQIGHMTLNYLFRESTTIKDASLLERSAYPLLDLIPMAMRTHTLTVDAFLHDMNLFLQIEVLEDSGTLEQHLEVGNLLRDDPLVYALYAIQRWYENLSHLSAQQKNKADGRQSEEDEEDEEDEAQSDTGENAQLPALLQNVYAVLSNAMNSAAQEERQRLRQVLFLWIKSGDLMLNRIARILISHSYVMDGIVLDLPASKRAGIVVIDGNRREREDRERIFYLLQNLSAIVPLHLHWLGYTRHSRFLSSDNRDEAGKTRDNERSASFGPDDLLLRGASRPSLLLPVMISGQGKGYVPEQSYFVAVFHTEHILDLAELYVGASGFSEERKGNIFKEHLQRQKADFQALSQPWQGKVYLLPSVAEQAVPASLSALLTVVRPESIGMMEEDLRRRVTITLRACSAGELWRDLRAYMGVPESHLPTFAGLANEIERWLEQLSDTSVLYPDVSLFILWTIMVRSLENLTEAIQLIELMLQAKAEESKDRAAKRARKLRQQMGIACTRMLFHFYGTDNPTLSTDHYGALLNLLPQVIASTNSYTEILPILSVLFQLATTTDWLQLLNENDGALFECINKVPIKDIAPLRDWLKYYQRLIAVSQLFIEFDRSFSDFRAFGEEVSRRYKSPQSQRPARGETLPPSEMASKFLAILPAEDAEEDKARYSRVLQRIEFQQAHLRNPDAKSATLVGFKNLEVLLNHLTSEFQMRLDGTIERLEQGKYYGVVIVEAQNKTAVHQAFLFLQEFVKQRRQGKGQHITLMLQRLGEKEILAKVRNNRKIKNEREISDRRKLPQVIGPLLERYPAEQVAFVLMIAATPIIDYDDWAEQDQWASRLWLVRLGKWHPYRGEMVALGESTQLTLETLLKRFGEGIENYDYVSLLPDHARTAANQSMQ